MMKKIVIIIFIVMVAFSANVFAQKSIDDILNIKEKVSKQIDVISKEEAKKLSKRVSEKKGNVVIGSTPGFSKNSLIKTFVFVEGSLLILIGLIVKRKLEEKKKFQLSRLKENIRKLRTEKIGSLFDVSRYNLRRRFIMQPIKISESEITKKAKEYSISKGEIHLALKIKLMQSSG